jgi:hypothetical protein
MRCCAITFLAGEASQRSGMSHITGRNKGAFRPVPLKAVGAKGVVRHEPQPYTHRPDRGSDCAATDPCCRASPEQWGLELDARPRLRALEYREEHESSRSLINAAVLAANAHNTQPWRFMVADHTISIAADAERHIGSFDPFRREMHQSLGCAIENLMIAARAHGFAHELTLFQASCHWRKFPTGRQPRSECSPASSRTWN